MNVYGSVLVGSGGGSVEYSTTEKAVGKWINGATLYQRTWTGTTSTSSNTTTFSIGSITPRKWEVYYSLDSSSMNKNIGTAAGFHYVSGTDTVASCCYSYEGDFYIEFNQYSATSYRGKAYTATIWYTK